MKKTYFVPTTDVVALNAQHMMAASDPKVTVDSSRNVNADAVETRQHHGFGGGLWEDMK